MTILGSRIYAWFIDMIVVTVMFFVLNIIIAFFAIALERFAGIHIPRWFGYRDLFWLIGMITTLLLYFGYYESSAWQATFGKRLTHLIVCDSSGQQLTFACSVLRTLYKVLPLVTLAAIILIDYSTVDIVTTRININIVYYCVLLSPVFCFVIVYLWTESTLHDYLTRTQVLMKHHLENDEKQGSLHDEQDLLSNS
jgi:uncharacterized RDD family membrane protein YckC